MGNARAKSQSFTPAEVKSMLRIFELLDRGDDTTILRRAPEVVNVRRKFLVMKSRMAEQDLQSKRLPIR